MSESVRGFMVWGEDGTGVEVLSKEGRLLEAADRAAEAVYGPFTHSVFWIGRSIIGNGETPTTLIVADAQPVFPVPTPPGGGAVQITDLLIERKFPAGQLKLGERAVVPLICATNDPAHHYIGVCMEKIGRKRL